MKRFLILVSLFAWASGAQAQLNEWVSQNPPNLSGVYHDIQMVSATTTYIVGDKGSVTKTIDGGESFHTNSVGSQNLYGVNFLDSLTGMIVGSNGVAYKTTDGGINWKPMNTGATEQLFGVLMVDENIAIICGGTTSSGTIRITRDGGTKWAPYTANELSLGYIRSIRMLRPDFIVFVGQGGQYYVSRDSAKTFTSKKTPYQNDIYDLCFLSDQSVIAVGGPGRYIIGSTDDGQHWAQRDTNNFSLGGALSKIDAKGQTVVAVGDVGLIIYSADGGMTYNRSYFGATSSIKAVSMFSPEFGMAVGADGVILKTTDGGATWGFLPSRPETNILRTVQMMPDNKTGFAAGGFGTILSSVDSGHTWLAAQSGTTLSLYGSALRPNGHGFVVGAEGTILATSDSGTSWTNRNSGTTKNIRSISAPTDNAIYAAGDSTLLLRSTDGGNTWMSFKAPFADSVGISSVAFFDSLRGLICSGFGVYLTSDGGSTWSLTLPQVNYGMTVLSIGSSPMRVYALGVEFGLFGGAVAYSDDGGKTWRETDFPQVLSPGVPLGIYTDDGHHATVVGRKGLILHTTEMGGVWETQRTPTSADLFGVDFGSIHSGWSCGFRGTILRIDTDEEADVRNPLAASMPRLQIDRIYPNPAVNRVRLSYTLEQLAPTSVEVFDLLGARMASFNLGIQGEGSHTNDLTLPQLPSGTYLLVLSSGGASATERVAIIH